MPICDQRDGGNGATKELVKGQPGEMAELSIVPEPAPLPGAVVESKPKKKTLSVFMRC